MQLKGKEHPLQDQFLALDYFLNFEKGAQIIKIPPKGHYDVQPQRCR